MIKIFATEPQALDHLATIDKTRWPQAHVCRILNPLRYGEDAFLIRLTGSLVLGTSGEAESNTQYFSDRVS